MTLLPCGFCRFLVDRQQLAAMMCEQRVWAGKRLTTLENGLIPARDFHSPYLQHTQ